MKSRRLTSPRFALPWSVLVLTLIAATDASAVLTWNNAGPNNNWSTSDANWTPGPTGWINGEDAVFGGTTEAVTVTGAVTVDDMTFGGSWGIGNGAGSITLADSNSDITVTTAGHNVTITEVIGGAGGITMKGAGTLTFFATGYTYTGPTIVDAGILRLARSTTATPTTLATSGITVNSGGTLQYDSFGSTWAAPNNAVSLNGGTLNFAASGTQGRYLTGGPTTTVNAASFITVLSQGGASLAPNFSNFFLDNGLKGSADLTVTSSTNGMGLVLRSANSTYSGHVTVNGNASATPGTGSGMAIDQTVLMSSADFTVNGMLELGNGAGMGWASSGTTGQTVSIDALAGTGVVVSNMGTAGSTRTLSLGNNNGGGNFAGQIVNGNNNTLSLIKNGSGTQILSGANTYSGATTINNGALQIGDGGTTGTLGSGAVSIASGASLIFNRSNNFSVANAISGAGGIIQNGSGAVTFSTAKTYTGATTVNSGAITHTAAVTNATTYSGAGTVNFDSGSSLGGSTVFGASFTGLINHNISLNIAGVANVFTNNRGDLNVASGTTFSINGVVGDATGPIRQFDELTGSGDIQNAAVGSVAPTTLTLGANNGNGGMAVFSGDITSASPSNGRISIIKNGSGSQTLSGNISTGNGTMTVNGGTLVLSGANTYAGLTTVNAGVLLVNGSLNSSANGVTVNANGTLGGTGSISRSVTVNGTLAPGASIQTLSTGTLTFNNGSTFAYEYDSAAPLASAADLQIVNGALNLNGVVTLALSDLSPSNDFQFLLGTTLSLINYTGAWDGDLFTYGGGLLADGATFAHGKYFWEIDYDATLGGVNFPGEHLPGHFVNLTAMALTLPEPSTFVLLGLASLGLGLGAYRRQAHRRLAASRKV